jgi:hypothetical protein
MDTRTERDTTKIFLQLFKRKEKKENRPKKKL